MSILVVGSSNIDFLLTTPYVPKTGETVLSKGSYTYVPGGKGANAAVTVSRLGEEVVFCTRVGDDAYGDRLKRIYIEEKIDPRFIKIDKTDQTGLAVIMLEKSGENRIIVFPGANKNINEADIESAFITYPSAVLTNMEISNHAVYFTSQLAASSSVPLILDCGGVNKDFKLEEIKKAEILSPNETETEILTGIRPNSLDDCLRACIKLCNTTEIKYVVLKLGSRGCFIYDGKYCDLMAAYEVQTVDTTAAGDAFTAALAVEYIKTNDIKASCKYANAAGALTVTKVGAISSLPSHFEILDFIEKQK